MKPTVKVTLVIAVMLAAMIPSGVKAQGFAFSSYTWGPFTLQPSVSLGYAASTKPVSLSFDMASGSRVGIQSYQSKLNVQGLWLELILPVRTSSPLSFGLGFGYLFPFNKEASETYDTISGGAERNWTTNTQMAKFDLTCTYDLSPTVAAVLGFRYDSLLINFKEPQIIGQMPSLPIVQPNFASDQTAELNFYGFFPMLGVTTQRVLGPSQSVRAGITGFPTLVGSFSYRENLLTTNSRVGGVTASNEFKSGYFLDAFADFQTPILSWAQLTAYAKYTAVYGKTVADVNANTMFPQAREGHPEDYEGRITSSTATFQRSVWFVGGAFSTTFWLW